MRAGRKTRRVSTRGQGRKDYRGRVLGSQCSHGVEGDGGNCWPSRKQERKKARRLYLRIATGLWEVFWGGWLVLSPCVDIV